VMGSCTWTENVDGNWETSCGEMFVFEDGTPSENGMKYCCYCGCVLVEKIYDPPQEKE